MPTTELGFFGQQFMIWVLILIPGFEIFRYIQTRGKKAPRPYPFRHRRAVVGQVVFLVVTLLAAREERVSLLSGPFPSAIFCVLAVVTLAIMGLRLRHVRANLSPLWLERARLVLPDHPSQIPWWVVISAMAGISEECAYRGLAMRFLTGNNGSFWLALSLCVLAFAVAHAIQGWRGILTTAVMALLMHALVYATKSLYLAIMVHAVYDLMVGLIALPILCKFAKQQELKQGVVV
ncbi:MAG: CPBP family intramembrane metalloprotease [Acidobacteria bacterium]|nr:CPBP family intramembrane metalloprotease [Acidobacteriota bacterium]